MKLHNPYLVGKKIYLRALEREDASGNWLNWFNDSDVTYYMYHGERPNTIESLIRYYEKTSDSDTDFVFAISEARNNEHIGNCGLHNVEWVHRRAALGIIIGEKRYWGKGCGEQAVKLLLDYAFDTLNLRRIYLGVNAENTSAVKCYEKCGFFKEGVLKKEIYKNGKYYDVLRMAVLKKD